jgi:integrase
MLLLTGQRLGEVLAMRWVDLDGDWWTVPSEATKNKRGHRVYLCAQTQGLLRTLRESGGSGKWVFPSPRTDTHVASVNKAVERFRGLSGIANWHPHDLRRTAATGMGDLEIPDSTIGLVLNHAAVGVTARYSRSSREREIANAWRMWGQRLEEIVRGEAPGDSAVRSQGELSNGELVEAGLAGPGFQPLGDGREF